MSSYRKIITYLSIVQQCYGILMCPDLHPCSCSVVLADENNEVKSGLSIDCSNQHIFNVSILSQISQFQIVTLAMRNISTNNLPPKYFENLQVEKLDLSGSHIEHVKKVLNKLDPNLSELKLNNVDLDKSVIGRLNRFMNLTLLSLSSSIPKTESLPRGAFKKLIELEFLDLSKNNLRSQSTVDLLHGLNNLKELNLRSAMLDLGNSLNFLKNVLSLEKLILDNNVNSAFTFGSTFEELNLDSLHSLSLKHNHIAKIQNDAFKRTKELTFLDLSHNELPMVPFAVTSQLFNLTHLNVSSNNITHILDNTFINLVNLKYLNFHNNLLGSFPRNAFRGLENLETLDLSSNQLTGGFFWVPGLRPLHSLLRLNISFNRLKYIQNDSFDTTPYLMELDISGNPLKFTDTMFSGIEFSLKNLFIRNLGMKRVPTNALQTIDQLDVLDLSNNRFRKLNKFFMKGINAKRIYLQNMDISKISSRAFSSLKGPISLFLDNNNIQSLSVVNFSAPCFYSIISLTKNPIKCDCDTLSYIISGKVGNIFGSCVNSKFYGFSLYTVNAGDTNFSRLCNSPNLSIGKCSSSGKFIINSATSLDFKLAILGFILYILFQ